MQPGIALSADALSVYDGEEERNGRPQLCRGWLTSKVGSALGVGGGMNPAGGAKTFSFTPRCSSACSCCSKSAALRRSKATNGYQPLFLFLALFTFCKLAFLNVGVQTTNPNYEVEQCAVYEACTKQLQPPCTLSFTPCAPCRQELDLRQELVRGHQRGCLLRWKDWREHAESRMARHR